MSGSGDGSALLAGSIPAPDYVTNNIICFMDTTTENKRGFGSRHFDPERQREIASMGGKAAHASGNAHEWNSETAREAGKKGGRNRQKFE
jgi:uncharacterized protein